MQSKTLFRLIIFLVLLKSFSTVNYEESDKYETVSKCEDKQLPRKRIVCFYRVEDEFRPYDVDPCLCTHLIYSYVAVRENLAFIAGKKGDLKFLTALKQQNPGLKILISLRPSNNQFIVEESERSNSSSLSVRTKFAKRVREFVRRHGLDGVDLDWEYFKEAHNHITKRETLLSVLNVLNNELKPLNETSEDSHNLLTITTSKYARDLTDYYDFSEIYRFVDFVNVPAYNFDVNPKTISHPSRLQGINDMQNMDSIIDLILALGLPQEQLVMGVPTHGTLYKLLNVSQTEPGSPATSWNNEEVIISHSKICAVRDSANWTLVRDKDSTAPYIYSKDKWIGFDDEISIKLKAKYIVLRQLSGLALWSLNDDDYSGSCGYGPFPLLQTIRSVFSKPIENINNNRRTDFQQNNDIIDSSFVAVVEKYGNVERITDIGPEDNQLSCSHSGYIRHPNDCSKFYRCVQINRNDETPEVFQYNCPIGLVFDDRYEMCNWPSWSPPCLGSGEIVTTPKKQYVCPTYGYFQDPGNCEFFYYCSDFGKSYLQSYQMKCPFDLAFDEEKLLCNWKWLVKGCPPVNPEDQIIRDLPHLLNQDSGNEPIGEESDKFSERSDYIDVDPNYPLLNEQINQNTNSDPDRKGGSRFRKITQYMTKLVGNLGNRFKSMFSNTRIESRSDGQTNRWLSRMNHYMPKFNKKRVNSDSNQKTKRISGKTRRPFDPLISIPILEIRPDSHNMRNRPIKGKAPPPNRKAPFTTPRHPINQFSLSGLQDPNDMFQLSSITKTVQKLQEIIPIKTSNRNRGKNSPKDQMTQSSNIREVKVPLSSSTSSVNPSRRPQKSSNMKNRFRSKFQFPTVEPILIETMEELDIPHYMPQKLSMHAPIPLPKKSNVRNQQQMYLGTVSNQKEVLHFKPEDLNLDLIKRPQTQTPSQQNKEREPQKQNNNKYVNNNRNNNKKNPNPMELSFQNIDSKLLDSLHYSLPENDKNEYQTIHLANDPNKQIKLNFNEDLKPSPTIRHNSISGQISHNLPKKEERPSMPELVPFSSNSMRFPEIPKLSVLSDFQIKKQMERHRNPEQHKIGSNKDRQRDPSPSKVLNDKIRNQMPINTINLGSPSIQYLNQFLPHNMELLHKPPHKPSVPQIKVESVPKQESSSHKYMNQKAKPNVRPQSQPQELDLKTFLSLPDFPEFEAQKVIKNKPKENKLSNNRLSNQQKPINGQNQRLKDINDQRNVNIYSEPIFKKNADQLDASASIREHFATYERPNQRPEYNKFNENKIHSIQNIKNKNIIKSSSVAINKEPEKSQLLIVPIDDYSEVHPNQNFETIAKEHPKLFAQQMFSNNNDNIYSEVRTTARPRVIFTAPASAPPSVPSLGPSLSDEYIMLMMNNDHNLLNHSDGQKTIHEIFKKTDGKLYNLETESSRTLVALVPKTPTTPKPVMYESITNLVSFNVTQPPVVIKFEIPRPKSEVFQSIVQKVREDWLSGPYSQQSSYTLPPYHVVRSEYQNPSVTQPYIPVTTTTTTQSPIDVQNLNLPSIYDSLQQILAQNNYWGQNLIPTTPSTPEVTSAPIPTTTQSSVILEHIPLYGGYTNNKNNNNNHTNGMSWPQSGIPWYQQVVSYSAPVNQMPYQSMPSYPQMGANYPYYPIQSGYGYRSPGNGPNIPPPTQFQPQFLGPNMTSNNWYEFYGNDQNSENTETTTTSTTTTTTSTTTPPTTTKIVVIPSTTPRTVPRVRSRPSFARRTSTTKRPKTTTEEIKVEVSSDNGFDIQRAHIRDKPKVEVIIVDEHNDKPEPTYRRPDISDQTDIKVVYMDGSKEDEKQTHYSDISPKIETRERYGLRNGAKITNQDKPVDEPEHYDFEPLPPVTETVYPKVEHQLNKDIEYDDEPELYEENRSTHSAITTPPTHQSVYNSNPYPGIRNITDNSVPESGCTRPGLFQHPFDCNKYYECFWDKYINKFTIHSFECPVKLAFDSRIVGCGLPNDPTICVQY